MTFPNDSVHSFEIEHSAVQPRDRPAIAASRPSYALQVIPDSSKALQPWTGRRSTPSQRQRDTNQTDLLNLAELHALQRVAQRGDLEKRRGGSLRKESLFHDWEQVGHFAAPLSPLRERDLQALDGLFQHPDMHIIEADVNQMLLQLIPVPCWEDDVFNFLNDFL